MQRHAAFAVELGAAHLGAAETAGELDADTLGASAHGILLSLTHRAAEGHAVRQLLGDALGYELGHAVRKLLGDALSDELGVDRRVLDFEDVELDLLAGELLELCANALGYGATAADHDARAGGVDVHTHAVTGTLNDDAGHACTLEVLRHLLTDGVVFKHEIAVA